ncbi:uncharacterized protein JCM6883_006429 [Sporobolomyces salmoneus]|uniref:uncharacterized protein n=1 Tax=Sporobolomyces salmoneus TaxID=183962 RepID=UPI003179DC5E
MATSRVTPLEIPSLPLFDGNDPEVFLRLFLIKMELHQIDKALWTKMFIMHCDSNIQGAILIDDYTWGYQAEDSDWKTFQRNFARKYLGEGSEGSVVDWSNRGGGVPDEGDW